MDKIKIIFFVFDCYSFEDLNVFEWVVVVKNFDFVFFVIF